ncbi:hypothetical protein RFI_31013, partial [Reticulomyxa filosa]
MSDQDIEIINKEPDVESDEKLHTNDCTHPFVPDAIMLSRLLTAKEILAETVPIVERAPLIIIVKSADTKNTEEESAVSTQVQSSSNNETRDEKKLEKIGIQKKSTHDGNIPLPLKMWTLCLSVASMA